jgi:drug/metabolite transporter (DMT)-like permease
MLLYCALSGRRVRISGRDAVRLAIIGILLLGVANTILAWAEKTVPTGLAALIVSITPLWFLIIETWILRGDHLSTRGLLGLPLGIFGIVVLLWPRLTATTALGRRELFACLALLVGSLAWSIGSVLSKRWQTSADPFVAAGWQMLFAGALNLAMAGVFGDYASAVWTARGVAAIAYLIIFGSWVGFSAYIWLLQNVSTPKVATYAYVNPVVAVILGALILGEQVTPPILIGGAVVVAGVGLVVSVERPRRQAAQPPSQAGPPSPARPRPAGPRASAKPSIRP